MSATIEDGFYSDDKVSICLNPEMAEEHQPRELVRLIGPGFWCTCGVSAYAPTDRGLELMWRNHLLNALGLLVRGGEGA